MSISRARAYLHEIQTIAHPSLTIDRPIETFASDTVTHRNQPSPSSLQKRPILSALQQANTTALGITFPVEIAKRNDGFGFTVTSRETAKGERLFYIGTVKANGAAVNKLRAGDRLLQISGEKTTGLTQNDVVERLKKLRVGDSVSLLVSRIGSKDDANQNVTAVKSNHDDSICEVTERYGEEILTLKIALNETGSAGLGISLKARTVMKPNGMRHDCGIFVKKVLHGGAAYKDGRLQLNDQLVGIEDIDLRRMASNSEASDTITRCLKNLGPNASSVCLRVARRVELRCSSDFPSVPNLTDESLASKFESTKVHDGSRTKFEDDGNVTGRKQGIPLVCNANISRRHLSSSNEHSLNVNEDLDSTSIDMQRCVSEDEMDHAGGSAFNRKNPTRRSISEKRNAALKNDANNTMLFQKIKHNRQMSAPVLHRFVPFVSPTPQSFSMLSSRSAISVREKCSRRSLASLRLFDEKTVTEKSTTFGKKVFNDCANVAPSPPSDNRRSLSLDIMEANRSPTSATAAVHHTELAHHDARVGQSAKRDHSNTLKRVQKYRCDDYIKPSTSDAEDQTSSGKNRDYPCASLPREISTLSKDKKQWRKSIGSGILSRITQRLSGSKSRDTSPEKSVSCDIAENSFFNKANRTKDHREWNEKESKSNQSIRRAPPPYKPPLLCGTFQSSNPDYYISDMHGKYSNGKELPIGGCIRVANSKFYSSFMERNTEYPGHCPTPEDNIRQEFVTADTVIEEKETSAPIAKEGMDAKMNYTHSLVNNHTNNSDKSVQSTRVTVSKNSTDTSSSWTTAQDTVPTTTMPSILGLHAVQLQPAEIYLSLQGEEADIRSSTFTFPQQRQKRAVQQYGMKDSDLAQLSSLHQECEQSEMLRRLVPTMQPATRIPVFPSSRTFFFPPSTRTSGCRINDSQTRARSNLRSRTKLVFVQPFKRSTSAESPNFLISQTSVFNRKRCYKNRLRYFSQDPVY